MHLAGVEQGDDQDRHDVIDDDRGGEEDAKFNGDTGAEQHDQRDGEGGVRADRDAPAVAELGGSDGRVNDRGQDDPAERRDDGECPRSEGREMAHGELALDLKPNDEKEHGQEPVVDPVEQRVRERRGAPQDAQGLIPERGELRAQR